MLSWSRTFEGETPLDLADFRATRRRLLLHKKEGFAKTVQSLKDKEVQI
jgi:hypothetical protein